MTQASRQSLRAGAEASGNKAKRIVLTGRDRLLLQDLFLFGAMTRGQLQRAHFGSVSRCNTRIKALEDVGLLARTLPAVSPQLAGAGQAVCLLGPGGVPVVAEGLGWCPAQVRERQRRGTPTYLAHTLGCVQFWLDLKDAVQGHGTVRLARFVPELLARHEYDVREGSGSWRREVFRPDGVFLLSKADHMSGWALELDLGHTSQREFLMKAAIHDRYGAAGLFAKRYGMARFVTLCLTTTPVRRENLAHLLEKATTTRFWFTTFAELGKGGVLGSTWYVPGAATPVSLIDDGNHWTEGGENP
jgi:hypothetical protein